MGETGQSEEVEQSEGEGKPEETGELHGTAKENEGKGSERVTKAIRVTGGDGASGLAITFWLKYAKLRKIKLFVATITSMITTIAVLFDCNIKLVYNYKKTC